MLKGSPNVRVLVPDTGLRPQEDLSVEGQRPDGR